MLASRQLTHRLQQIRLCVSTLHQYDAAGGFDVVDAVTHHMVASPVSDATSAVAAAVRCGAKSIWQQSVYNRGREMGEPYLLRKLPPKTR
jgi:hypothetical protein